MIRSWLIAIATLSVAAAPLTAAPPPAVTKTDDRAPAVAGANEKLGQSYILMAKGENAWKTGDRAAASGLYGDALDILEAMETDYPGFATYQVRSRILTCETALERLRDGKGPEAEPVAGAKTGGSNTLGAMSFVLSGSASETAIKALKAGIEERDAALSDVRAELLALKKDHAVLKERLAALEGKSGTGEAQAIPVVLKSQVRQWVAVGAYSNAVALLVEMRALYPDDPGVHLLLGLSFCRLGSFDDALRELEPLVKKGKASADVWMTLGVAYMNVGNLGKARQSFEEALDTDANLSEAHFNLAHILIRLKKPDADLARRHYMMAVELGSLRDEDLEMAINQSLMNEQARKMKR
jgi:Flp pilus assembly protein TadD